MERAPLPAAFDFVFDFGWKRTLQHRIALVEERRFSAAPKVKLNWGFSPYQTNGTSRHRVRWQYSEYPANSARRTFSSFSSRKT